MNSARLAPNALKSFYKPVGSIERHGRDLKFFALYDANLDRNPSGPTRYERIHREIEPGTEQHDKRRQQERAVAGKNTVE
jgi:hypothetical protein